LHRIRLLVVALVAIALSFTGLSTASASTRAPQVKDLGAYAVVSKYDPTVVKVTGSYKCFGGQPIHLWVSVKQGGPDPTAPGSSRTVDAWYDTNISLDVYVKCDGKWHTRTVQLGAHPVANYPTDAETDPPTRPLDLLHNGKAWLQFCLVDEQNGLLASKSRWVTVKGAPKGDGYGGPILAQDPGYGPQIPA
jgi:hypothetical protein